MKNPPVFAPVSRRRFIGQLSAAAALALWPRWSRAADAPVPAKKFGVALVGLGSYSTYELGPALRQTKYCRLTGVVTGSQAKGEKWARDYGFSKKNIFGYDTMARMAGNPDIDFIYVVTPNGLHAQHCIAAAKAGKHVICEKPMANTAAECDTIIAACKAAGVRLTVGYRLHYEPHHAEFARLAREQTFGPFMKMSGANGFRMGSDAAAYSAWRLNKKLAGGGPLMDMGVYVIQAACMAKAEAPPVAVTARFDPVNRPELFVQVEESVKWTMEFSDGALARCQATYNENVSHFRAEGAHGWAELGEPAFYYDEPNLTTSRGRIKLPAVNHQVAQLDGMARELIEGRPSLAPGEMGRRDLTIVDAIYASANAGGVRVEVKA
jgi:glucose-fructose oxidoreductase